MTVYVFIGLPRSGKSTIAVQWQDQTQDFIVESNKVTLQGIDASPRDYSISNRVVVRADDIRLDVTGQRFYAPAEKQVAQIKETMVRVLLKQNVDILIDGTHTQEYSIKEVLGYDKNAVFYYVPTPADTCKLRAIATDQEDLVPIIDRMDTNLRKMVMQHLGYCGAVITAEDIHKVVESIRSKL